MVRVCKLAAFVAVFGVLAACDNDVERGAAGAATGAVIAGALDSSILAGAVIGGAAGVFCDDAGVRVCQ
ncbi:hypothetical protein [Parasulfitobacter algicola]|uniref:YMGG-like Gly-zipper domain-containing protein n=1 Tax=Parasulfitobacter algicola TaxID=2614809 RepID=A0ABX2IW46_9RHOB|nr:hypothetical protein [Sulfitobacter algicola]NSX56525.1 hypothetical protein [Sulfitobacter algicola]